MPDAVKSLSWLFRLQRRSRPILLLGAGASFRAGIPVAEEAVRRIARTAYARHEKGLDEERCVLTASDWVPYLERQSWFISEPGRYAENFPLAVQHLLFPREFRREFFQKILRPYDDVTQGYRSLARIMVRRLCWTVLTTNFDTLAVDALRQQQPHPPQITEINRTADDLVQFSINNPFQIVYLHGAVETYRDRNLIEETQRLDEKLVSRIRPMLIECPLIVVGYRGSEPSIMQHLLDEGIQDTGGYRHGIYWCLRKGATPHPTVRQLQEKLGSNFQLVEIDGFDELMTSLDAELENEIWYTAADAPIVTATLAVDREAMFDTHPEERLSTDDLDEPLILSTLSDYCQRLHFPAITKDNYIKFLEAQGYLVRRNGKLVPTTGCVLLFGLDIHKVYPYARVVFNQDEKRQTIFEGNLITQYRKLLDLLTSPEVNPVLRLKGERKAEELPAYPERALSEIVVNMLVHRDYSIEGFSHIGFQRGVSLTFENPGGLLPAIKSKFHFYGGGRFRPVRGLTEMRNPLLADIFYGLGSMDKAGSGLVDVRDMVAEGGGETEYAVSPTDDKLSATLFQPRQEEPEKSSVARRVASTEVFVTNLLPFRVIPASVSVLRLKARFAAPRAQFFEAGEFPGHLPIWLKHAGSLYSFANFRDFPEFLRAKGELGELQRIPTTEFLRSCRSHIFPWLLGRHFEFFLYKLGLTVESRRKRAYFRLTDGEATAISYISRTGRRVTRTVVKRRGEFAHAYYESESIHYRFNELQDNWVMQVRPGYVFTRDGVVPLPPFLQTRRATRRFKFDRNPNVDDDLTFWARYLSGGQPLLSLGGVGVDDLILDSEFCSVEAPTITWDE